MEENLITVDLNKNLIIPIKEPFNKKELAHFVADHFEYDKGEKIVENKLFEGTFDDFQKFAKDNPNLQIIQVNNGSVNYQETYTKPYDVSKMEFGIFKYLKPSTDFLIELLTKSQIENAEKKIEKAKEELELQKNEIEKNLASLKDVKLT